MIFKVLRRILRIVLMLSKAVKIVVRAKRNLLLRNILRSGLSRILSIFIFIRFPKLFSICVRGSRLRKICFRSFWTNKFRGKSKNKSSKCYLRRIFIIVMMSKKRARKGEFNITYLLYKIFPLIMKLNYLKKEIQYPPMT